jgi:hypothetical protein
LDWEVEEMGGGHGIGVGPQRPQVQATVVFRSLSRAGSYQASLATDATLETTSIDTLRRLLDEAREVLLGLGDAVFFHGTKSPHWRHALPEGHESKACFLHFVESGFRGSLE